MEQKNIVSNFKKSFDERDKRLAVVRFTVATMLESGQDQKTSSADLSQINKRLRDLSVKARTKDYNAMFEAVQESRSKSDSKVSLVLVLVSRRDDNPLNDVDMESLSEFIEEAIQILNKS